MSNAVAKVAFLQGQAWAKAPDGTLRALTVGSTLNDDEILITAQGAKVELDSGNGEPLVINGGLTIGVSRDLFAATATEPDEALLSDASVQEALTVLEQGGDLLDELEETAAGNSGGSGSDGGSSFVRLTRLIESTDSQSFEYDRAGISTREVGESDGEFVNHAPVVTDQTFSTNEDEPFSGSVIAEDIEGDALTFTVNTAPANGVVVLDPATGQFTYTPNANYNGPESFVVTVTDSRGSATDTRITFNVVPVNDVPTTNDVALTTSEDVAVPGQVVAQDIEGDTLAYAVTGNPANGTVTLNAATGAFVYTPNVNFNGGDSFKVTVSDGNGGTTTSTVTIGVNPVNDAPVLVITQVNNFVEDAGAAVGDVVATFTTSDADGDTVTVTLSDTVNYALVGNTVTLTAAGLALVNSGADLPTFTLTPNDGTVNGASVSANPAVTPANDAPVLVITQVNNFVEDAGAAVGDVVATFTTSDADGDTVTVTLSDTVNYALVGNTVTLTAAGLALVNSGSDLPTFTLTPNDGTVNGAAVSANPSVTPANDAPVLVITQVNNFEEDAGAAVGDVVATFTTSDADNDTVTVTLSDTVNYALVGNTVTLTAAGLALVNSGADLPTFTLTPNDGTVNGASVSANPSVTAVNDAPVLVITQVNNFEEDAGAAVGDVVATFTTSDADNDTVTVTLSDTVNYALVGNTVTLTAAGLALVNSGSDLPTFTLTPNDGTVNGAAVSANPSVTPANDAPVLVITQVNNFVEDAGAAVGDVVATFTTSDADNDTVTVTLSDTVNYALSGNTVTLTAAGLALVNSGSDLPTFTLTPNDGTVNGAAVSANPSVTPANDAPVLVITQVNNFVEDAGAAVGDVVATFTTSDADNDTVIVTLSDTVNYALSGNTVTLTAAGLALVNSGADLPSFTLTPNDGTVNGASVSADPSVTPANDAPVLVITQVNNFVEDAGAAVGDVVATFTTSDADNDTVIVTLSDTVNYALSGNTVTLTAAGLALVNSGADLPTFTLTPNDGTVNGASVSADPSVTPANDAPVLVITQVNNFVEDAGAAVGDVVATFTTSDADNDTVTVTLSDTVNYALSGNTVTLTAAGLALVNSGADLPTFTLTPNDGTVNGAAVSANPSVTPANDAPVLAITQVNNFVEDAGAAVGDVVATFTTSDADNDTVTVTLSDTVNYALVGNTVTLTAAGLALVNSGADLPTFTLTPNDGTVNGASVSANPAVTPANDAPVLVITQVNNFVEDAGAAVGDVVATFTTSDADNDTVTVTLSDTVNYALSGNTVTLTAAGLALVNSGADLPTFTLTPNDGTVNGAAVSANPSVTPTNDAPVAHDDFFTINEGQSLSIPFPLNALLANDTDADGDSLTVYAVGGPVNGSFSIVGGNLVFTPTANFSGTASFTYNVMDPSFETGTATVYITVLPVDDPTIAMADTDTIAEGGVAAGNVLANDTDPDSALAVASFVVNSTTYNAGDTAVITGVGSVTLTATGLYTFTPIDSDYNGSVPTITYTTNTGASSTLDITVTPVNDAPQTNTVSATGNEDSLVTINLSGTDNDGTVVGFVIKTLPANGVLYSDSLMTTPVSVGDKVSGTVYFMPSANWNGSSNFTYAAQDDLGLEDATPATASITVNPVADPAVLGVGTGSVKEDTPAQSSASGTLTISDPDGASEVGFIGQANVAGTYGSFSVNAAGSWIYNIDNTLPAVQTLKKDQEKTETFTVASNDGTTTTVTITVIGTNDGPVAVADTASVNQNAVLTLTPAQLLANDTDLDGDTLSINTVQGAVNGTVSLSGGNVIFTPTPGYFGSASFTYTVIDGQGGSATATVNVNVVRANTAPVAVDDPSLIPIVAGGIYGWTHSFVKNITATGGTLLSSWADGERGALGVKGNGDEEIQYGESVTVTFDSAILDATFEFAKLDFVSPGNHEIGLWIAYLNGKEVARGQFQPTDTTHAGKVQVKDSSGQFIAFDQIRFENVTAVSDYLVKGITASRTATTLDEGGTLNKSAAQGVLANDTDANTDVLTVTAVQKGAEGDGGTVGTLGEALHGVYGTLTLNADGSYRYVADHSNTLKAGAIVKDYFTYTVSDGHSGTDTATLTFTIIGDGAINGTAAADIINGTTAADVIIGGAGNDTLTGGSGADTFRWGLGDSGTAAQPAIDRVNDFTTGTAGDRLDLRDLLQGENSSNLTSYLHFSADGPDTVVSINSSGGFNGSNYGTATDQKIVLANLSLSGTDADIITQLKNNGNLITD